MSKLTTQEIEMFSKATEIQEKWQPQLFDTFLCGGKIDVFTEVCHCEDCNKFKTASGRNFIFPDEIMFVAWIPTQDQLQYISFGEYNAGQFVEATIRGMWAWWVDCMHIRKECSITSMWQMWLCFVMHYKFNKVWNGADWVFVDLRFARVSPARHWIEENGE